MFRALLCLSSGARNYDVDYHIYHRVRAADFSLQPRHYSSLTAPNLQNTVNQERNDQCGNHHHSCELLMMYIVMIETCWAYKKYNKISSGIQLDFYSSAPNLSLRLTIFLYSHQLPSSPNYCFLLYVTVMVYFKERKPLVASKYSSGPRPITWELVPLIFQQKSLNKQSRSELHLC